MYTHAWFIYSDMDHVKHTHLKYIYSCSTKNNDEHSAQNVTFVQRLTFKYIYRKIKLALTGLI